MPGLLMPVLEVPIEFWTDDMLAAGCGITKEFWWPFMSPGPAGGGWDITSGGIWLYL